MSDLRANPISPTLIYTRVGLPPRVSIAGRAIAAMVALVCLAVLITGMRLQPSPDGMGTHREMGFPACQFFLRTGLPCPSCGMTTSFSWFVRGNVLASLYVQPMGCLLALLTCACAWTATYITLTGRPTHQLLRLVPARYYLLPIMFFALLAWGWKMFIHLRGLDGWR